MHPTAHRCQHPDPRPITVVNESGSHRCCGLCALQLIAEGERRADITVFVAPRVPA
jgi:hypothetical protein